MKTSLILPCAGVGARVGADKNKLLLSVNGQTVLDKTLSAFIKTGLIDEYIIACNKTDFDLIFNKYSYFCKIVLGGSTRTQSVKNALNEVTGEIVLIHDGARPNVSAQTIKNCIEGAKINGSAVALFPSRNTICKTQEGKIVQYLGKDNLAEVQTPQAFLTEQIKSAYQKISDGSYNDDGEVYFNAYGELYATNGNAQNVKITFKEDLNALSPSNGCRFGVGFDCHKLIFGRKLILGGVEIAHEKGLLGHSDADVLTHAIMDALLSGAGLRDIGYYFPDTDDKYKGANSTSLLKEVVSLLDGNGYKPQSISAVIMAQKPKLLKHIPNMVETLSIALNIDKENIGLGATTLEGLGFVGREEGICVHANAVIVKK